MQETWVWSLGREDPLEKGMAIHSSILAWKIPWTVEPGGLQSMELQRIRHDWENNTYTHAHVHFCLSVWATLRIHDNLHKMIDLFIWCSNNTTWSAASMSAVSFPLTLHEHLWQHWASLFTSTSEGALTHLKFSDPSVSGRDLEPAVSQEALMDMSHLAPHEQAWRVGWHKLSIKNLSFRGQKFRLLFPL